MASDTGHAWHREGLLYPLIVIVALALAVFSVVSVAHVSGWMPNAMVGHEQQLGGADHDDAGAGAGVLFQCAECGVIETIRELERLNSLPIAASAVALRR